MNVKIDKYKKIIFVHKGAFGDFFANLALYL